jgi:hypothetical protein
MKLVVWSMAQWCTAPAARRSGKFADVWFRPHGKCGLKHISKRVTSVAVKGNIGI